jgi:hypothetical protein
MAITEGIKKVYNYLTEENSKDFTKRKYYFYLLFGETKNLQFPWKKDVWDQHVQSLIDRILVKSPEYKNTGIKVLNYQRQPNSEYYKDLKLGKLRWDSKSHDKWTIKNDNDIIFQNFQLWTPIWTICDKSNSAPDIFITINNESDFTQKADRQFNVFAIIAIATDLNVDCRETIIDLSKQLHSKRTVLQTRKWSEGKKDNHKNWTFNNWIQDTFSNGIYRQTSLHNFNFKDIVFEPYWETIYEEK